MESFVYLRLPWFATNQLQTPYEDWLRTVLNWSYQIPETLADNYSTILDFLSRICSSFLPCWMWY